MKKLLFLLAFCGLGLTLSAQVAVKAGVNFANMIFEEDQESIEDLTRNGAVKPSVGLSFILPFGSAVALQPELLYTRKGATSEYKFLGTTSTTTIDYDYIDVPVLLRLSLGDTHGEGLGIYVNGGVYGGYALGGSRTDETPLGTIETTYEFDDTDDERRLDFGFAGGAGLTLGNIFLEARYMHGTNNLRDDDADNTNDGSFKKLQHRGVGLYLGIIF